MKLGQIQTQIFVYAVGILVVGLILVFSYNAIRGLGEQADDVALVKFSKDMTSDFESVRKNFGNVRVFTYSVPSGYSKLCFADTTKDCSTCDPLIKDSVLSGVESNAFLVKNSGGFEAFSLGSLTNRLACFQQQR